MRGAASQAAAASFSRYASSVAAKVLRIDSSDPARVVSGDCRVPASWASEANRRKVTAGFSRLADLQREGHFEVLVMIWPLMTDYQAYRFGWIHEWVAREATKAGFAVLDLLPRLSSVPYRKLQVSAEDTVHPNALGHRLGAEAFLAWYRSTGRGERSGGKS